MHIYSIQRRSLIDHSMFTSHAGEFYRVYRAKLQKAMEKEDHVEQTMKVAVKTLKGCYI